MQKLQGQLLVQLTEECVESYVLNKYPERTVKNLRNFLGRFLRWIGERELTVKECKDYVKYMQSQGLRASSINSDLGRLKMFLGWLFHEKELTAHDLGKDIKRPKIRVSEDGMPEQLLSAEKLEELINMATTPAKRPGKLGLRDEYINREYREFLHFLRKMGLRPGEAMNIKPEHVNLDGSPPSVSIWRCKGGRGGKWVSLGLPLDYLEPIRERVERGKWFEVHPTGLQRIMKIISKLSGKKINLYSIRKSVDTGMLDNDAPIMHAAVHQGHNTTVMQKDYIKFSAKQSSFVNNTFNPHIDRAVIPIEYQLPEIERKQKEWALHPNVTRQYEVLENEGVREAVYTIRVRLN